MSRFSNWLVKRTKERNAVGDLAKDVEEDMECGGFPESEDLQQLVEYLESRGACDDAIEAMKTAHGRWDKAIDGKL